MKKAKNYSQVLQELEETLEKMNRGEISIDNLEAEVKAAAEKITFLRRRLKSTEAEITKILQDIENEEPND
ncbi:MAG TPA: exodeoxyribonuclease VII small subunit [Deltaproteobacteria bacterium]|nr:exodeoxyribonuclease VII small subunit [Deltaproteobacteria bacterium]HPJ94183.1 exodeoxyribonuclease VII small subunit [Deltaproteobacteria bacterium]HPR51873.1 exodeoxyribonuclease VII small subunit [Deltaproteobacteria bacterium]